MPTAGECIAGRYRLECPLGEGGMGSVWRARHLELDVPIAVKFQHAHRARSKGAAARFRKEARAAARLKSLNVVRVVDFGVDGDVAYLAMELLEGESLKTRLERSPSLPVDALCEVVRQSASALDTAHEAGIVHRDIKPSNLFLVPVGQREVVKLLDFGIAKWFEGGPAAEGTLTEDDMVVGSVRYMSPEQAGGELVDPRSDVWSLAVVAYEMLTGVVPFDGANIPDTLRRICAARFEPPSRVVSAAYAVFDPVFQRAFELEPDLRFETAGDFSVALSAASGQVEGRSESVPSVPPAGGWTFGRDGATLSVPIERLKPRQLTRRRSVGLLATAVATASALLLFLPPGRRPAPMAAVPPAPAAAPTVPEPPSGPPKSGVKPPASVEPSAEPTPRDEGRSPVAQARRRKRGMAPAVAPAVDPTGSLASSETRRESASAPLSASIPAPVVAPPAVSVSSPTPATHVHPVFGLEVQAQR